LAEQSTTFDLRKSGIDSLHFISLNKRQSTTSHTPQDSSLEQSQEIKEFNSLEQEADALLLKLKKFEHYHLLNKSATSS